MSVVNTSSQGFTAQSSGVASGSRKSACFEIDYFYYIVSIVSISIKNVAQKAGVSLGTVSNAINRPELLAPETLRKVQKAIDALGFVPNASARTLRDGKTRVLGLIVPDISNPFFAELSKGVSDAALAAGYVVILCNTDENSNKEEKYIGVLASQNVRGILITPARDSNKSLAAISSRGIGLTLVDRAITGIDACSVAVDDAIGGALALKHLWELGHRKILLLTGATDIPQVYARETGINTAILEIAKIDRPTIKKIQIRQMSTTSAGEALTAYVLENGLDFTAVICGNDLVALGAIRSLKELNHQVPQDVSIIGYDDIEFAASAKVPLTSIAQPKYQLGLAAAELVIEECENPASHVHKTIVFQPQLVVRESTTNARH